MDIISPSAGNPDFSDCSDKAQTVDASWAVVNRILIVSLIARIIYLRELIDHFYRVFMSTYRV